MAVKARLSVDKDGTITGQVENNGNLTENTKEILEATLNQISQNDISETGISVSISPLKNSN